LSIRTQEFESRYGGELLESVSRTFFLSLKFLPTELRGSVSLAYLLARATDTVADADRAPVDLRLARLADLGREIGGGDELFPIQDQLVADVVPHLDDEGEVRLLREMDGVLDWFRAVPESHQAPIRRVIDPILRGQVFDVERFPKLEGGSRAARCLPDAEALDEYTYLVAGSVGAFWTEICSLEIPKFSRGMALDEMTEKGVRMGKGLQLINVLRDFPRDLSAGRCYLPATEIKAAGIDPTDPDLGSRAEELWPLARSWMERCRGHLDEGLEYLLEVRPKRLLLPTALPLMLAAKTLRRLEQADWPEIEGRLKVSRQEVQETVTKTSFAMLSRKRLEKLYREA